MPMRRPTPLSRLLAWHTSALAGDEPPRHETWAEVGWYKRRFVKNGPWVPARIYVRREIDPETGDLTAPEELAIEVEGIDGGDPLDHWTYLIPISKSEFDHLVDYRLRDVRMMDTRRPIDLTETPTLPQGVF